MDAQVEIKVEWEMYNDSFRIDPVYGVEYTTPANLEHFGDDEEDLRSSFDGHSSSIPNAQENPPVKKKRRRTGVRGSSLRKSPMLNLKSVKRARILKLRAKAEAAKISGQLVKSEPKLKIKIEREEPSTSKKPPKTPVQPSSSRPKRNASIKSQTVVKVIIENQTKETPKRGRGKIKIKPKRKQRKTRYPMPENWAQMTKTEKEKYRRVNKHGCYFEIDKKRREEVAARREQRRLKRLAKKSNPLEPREKKTPAPSELADIKPFSENPSEVTDIKPLSGDFSEPSASSSSKSVKQKKRSKNLRFPVPDNWDQLTTNEKKAFRRKNRQGYYFEKDRQRKESQKAERKLNKQARAKNKVKVKAEISEEERKNNAYIKRMGYFATLPKEVIKARRQRDKEKLRIRRRNWTEEQREAAREKNRKYIQSLTGEKLERYKENMKKGSAKYVQGLRLNDPEKYKRLFQKDPYRIVNGQRVNVRIISETPEQRQKRLLMHRISQAKRIARKKLEQEGATPEEIARRLMEVIEEVKSRPIPPTISEYKPKPRKNPPKPYSYKPRVRLPKINISPGLDVHVSQPQSVVPHPSESLASTSTLMESRVDEEVNCGQIESFGGDSGPPSPVSFGVPEEYEREEYDDSQIFTEMAIQIDNFPQPKCEGKDENSGSYGAYSDLNSFQPVVVASASHSKLEIIDEKQGELKIEDQIVTQNEPHKVPPTPIIKATSGPSTKECAICEECGKSLKNPHYLRVHKKVMHSLNGPQTQCPHCPYTGKLPSSLFEHFLRMHMNSTGVKPTRRVEGEKYIQKRGTDTINQCDQCGKSFKQKCYLDYHIRTAHEGKGFYCDICPNSGNFQGAGKLWRHKVEKHGLTNLPPPQDAIQCKYCNEIVLRGYERHVQKDHPEMLQEFLNGIGEKFKASKLEKRKSAFYSQKTCPECGIQVVSLPRHLKNIHGIGKQTEWPCEECGRVFKDKYHMNDHYRKIHENAEIDLKLEATKYLKYDYTKTTCECTVCHVNIKFPTVFSVHVHFITEHPSIFEQVCNSSEPLLECDYCSEKFHKAREVSYHVEASHPEQENGWKERILMRTKGRRKRPNKSRRRKQSEYDSYDTFCRVCNIALKLASVSDHLMVKHGIDESELCCEHCSKTFRKREFWAGHVEEIHGIPLEQLVPKADDSNPKIRREGGTRKNRVKKVKAGGRKRRIKTKKKDKVSDEEDVEVDTSVVLNKRLRGKRKKREENVEEQKKLVICIVKLSEEEIQSYIRKVVK